MLSERDVAKFTVHGWGKMNRPRWITAPDTKPRPDHYRKVVGDTKSCSTQRQGDELICWCGLRWDATEDRPPCPKVEP